MGSASQPGRVVACVALVSSHTACCTRQPAAHLYTWLSGTQLTAETGNQFSLSLSFSLRLLQMRERERKKSKWGHSLWRSFYSQTQVCARRLCIFWVHGWSAQASRKKVGTLTMLLQSHASQSAGGPRVWADLQVSEIALCLGLEMRSPCGDKNLSFHFRLLRPFAQVQGSWWKVAWKVMGIQESLSLPPPRRAKTWGSPC